MTFTKGDIVEWVYHPRHKYLIGTLAEIIAVEPAGELLTIFMTGGSSTEAWYDLIDVHGDDRGACHSWLRRAPPVAINQREEAQEA